MVGADRVAVLLACGSSACDCRKHLFRHIAGLLGGDGSVRAEHDPSLRGLAPTASGAVLDEVVSAAAGQDFEAKSW